MANSNSPNGFRILNGPTGAAPSMAFANPSWLAVYNAAAMYFGDPVKIGSDGYIVPWTVGTNTAQLVGIFQGCTYLSVSQGRFITNNYWPGSDVASGNYVQIEVAPIMRAPNSLFLVQATSTPFTQADIGANVDVSMGTGNTTTGMSGATLDHSTIGPTTATLPFTVMGLYGQNFYGGTTGVPGSDPTTNYNLVIVSSNSGGVAGV